VQPDNDHEAAAQQCRIDRAALRLQRAKEHVPEQQHVGQIDELMQRLPHGRPEIAEPEVVARRRHDEQNDQRAEAEDLERELRDVAEVRERRGVIATVCSEDADEWVRIAERMKLNDREDAMHQREQRHRHSEMAAIVEQREKARIEPRQRTDGEDDVQQQKPRDRREADDESLRRRARMPQRGDRAEHARGEQDEAEQREIVELLLPIPADGFVSVAHKSAVVEARCHVHRGRVFEPRRPPDERDREEQRADDRQRHECEPVIAP
jgi:hypothetical protein